MYVDYDEHVNKTLEKPEQNTLFQLIYAAEKNKSKDGEKKFDSVFKAEDGNKFEYNKRKSCDETFLEYLYDCAEKTTGKYFAFIFKFIVLFREALNKFKPGDEKSLFPNDKDYSQIRNCELCPDICNDFITDYLEGANYFGMSEDNEDEFIELMQHFCHWLFEKGQTTARLAMA